MTEDEMVWWHHQLNGHEFEQTLGDGEGQGSLAAAVHGVSESDKTEQLNNNNSSKVWLSGPCLCHFHKIYALKQTDLDHSYTLGI